MRKFLSDSQCRVLALLVTIHLSSPVWAASRQCVDPLSCNFPPSIADCERSGAFENSGAGEEIATLAKSLGEKYHIPRMVTRHLAGIYNYIRQAFGEKFTLVAVGRDAIMFGYLFEALASELRLPIEVIRLGCSSSTIESTDAQLRRFLDRYRINPANVRERPHVFFDAVGEPPGGRQPRRLLKILGEDCARVECNNQQIADHLGFIGVSVKPKRDEPVAMALYFARARQNWHWIYNADPQSYRLEVGPSFFRNWAASYKNWVYSRVWYDMAELWNASFNTVQANDHIAYGASQRSTEDKKKHIALVKAIRDTVRANRATLARQIGCALPDQAAAIESWPCHIATATPGLGNDKLDASIAGELLDASSSTDSLPDLFKKWRTKSAATDPSWQSVSGPDLSRIAEFHKYCFHTMKNMPPTSDSGVTSAEIKDMFLKHLAAVDLHELLKRPAEAWQRYLNLSSQCGPDEKERALTVISEVLEHHGAEENDKINAFVGGLDTKTLHRLTSSLGDETRSVVYRRIPQIFSKDRIFNLERSHGSSKERILAAMGGPGAWRRFLERSELISDQELENAFAVVGRDIDTHLLMDNAVDRKFVEDFMVKLRPKSVYKIMSVISQDGRASMYKNFPKLFPSSLIYDVETHRGSSDELKTSMMTANLDKFSNEYLAEHLECTDQLSDFAIEIWTRYGFAQFTDADWRDVLEKLPMASHGHLFSLMHYDLDRRDTTPDLAIEYYPSGAIPTDVLKVLTDKFGQQLTSEHRTKLMVQVPDDQRGNLLATTDFESMPTDDSCRLIYDVLREHKIDGLPEILAARRTSDDAKFYKRFLDFAMNELRNLSDEADIQTMAARIKPLVDSYPKRVTRTRHRMRNKIQKIRKQQQQAALK